MNYKIRCVAISRGSQKGTVGRNINTCHATAGFLTAVEPYPWPDWGKAQIPGGWAVQQVRVGYRSGGAIGIVRPLGHGQKPLTQLVLWVRRRNFQYDDGNIATRQCQIRNLRLFPRRNRFSQVSEQQFELIIMKLLVEESLQNN